MDLERERGITIKAQSVRMNYTAKDGKDYVLNLIDTPGHVDFAYEVSRSPGRLRGRAAGGRRHPGRRGPDPGQRLPGARPRPGDHPGHQQDRPALRRRRADARGDRGGHRHRRLRRRSRVGQGGHRHHGDPRGDRAAGAAAQGRPGGAAQGPGVRQLVRQLPGRGDAGARARGDAARQAEAFSCSATSKTLRGAGARRLQPVQPARCRSCMAGEVGVRHRQREGRRTTPRWATRSPRPRAHCTTPFPGFKEIKPMVFCGIFPVDAADYEHLETRSRSCASTIRPSPTSPRLSQALGFGFRCGYLGLLHMEIVQERLEREYNLTPHHHRARRWSTRSPPPAGRRCWSTTRRKLPPAQNIEHLEEPLLTCHIHCPGRVPGGGPEAVPGPARRAEGHQVPRHPEARPGHLRACRWPRWSSTSSTS